MARKCKAILNSGTRKGSRCQQNPKFSGYCGRHKYLLVEESKSKTKLERTALISSLGANLIVIAEKTSEHWPEVVEVLMAVGKCIGVGYPVPDIWEFNELQRQNSHWRKIDTRKALEAARDSISKGKATYSNLKQLAEVIEATSNNRKDILEAEKVITLIRKIESQGP